MLERIILNEDAACRKKSQQLDSFLRAAESVHSYSLFIIQAE